MTDRDPRDAERLRAMGSRLRIARGAMTQVALSEATAINQSTLSKYERGELEPGVLSIEAVARACGVSLEWLVTGTGPGPSSVSPATAA